MKNQQLKELEQPPEQDEGPEPSAEELERQDFKLRSECSECVHFDEFKTKRQDEPSWFGCSQGRWSGYLIGDKAACGLLAFSARTPKVTSDG
jgi:hypothetical protein